VLVWKVSRLKIIRCFFAIFHYREKRAITSTLHQKKGDYEYIFAAMVTFSHPFLRTQYFFQKGWPSFWSGYSNPVNVKAIHEYQLIRNLLFVYLSFDVSKEATRYEPWLNLTWPNPSILVYHSKLEAEICLWPRYFLTLPDKIFFWYEGKKLKIWNF